MDLIPGDVLFRATLTGTQTFIHTEINQTDTATTAVDVTFKATQGDIASVQIQGGTMSIIDETVGDCTGSSTFAGVIPSYDSHLDDLTSTTGNGVGTLVLNGGNDGISRNPGDPRVAISFVILLGVSLKASCNGHLLSGFGTSVTSCVGDRSTSTTFIVRKTGSGTFAGTCHDDMHGQEFTSTLDWTGEAHQISP